MRRHPELDERTAEDILHGRSAALEGADRLLAEAMVGLRSASVASTPRPNDALRQVFAEGIASPEERATPVAQAARKSGRRALPSKDVARIAGLGLAAKLLLAGAAVGATAVGGAGAAGVLPWQGGDLPPAEPPAEAEADAGQDRADEATPDRAPGIDIADEARQIREAGERREEAQRSHEAQRSDGAADEPGEAGLGEAGDHTDRAPESVPQSGDTGREHAEGHQAGTPAGEERSDADDAPAGDRSEPIDPRGDTAGSSTPGTSGEFEAHSFDDPGTSGDRGPTGEPAGTQRP